MEDESWSDHSPLHTTLPSDDSTGLGSTSTDTPSSPGIFTPPRHSSRGEDASDTIAKVEAVFESIVDGLLQNSDELSIPLKVKKSHAASESFVADGLEPRVEFRKVTFPGRNGHEAWRFSMALDNRDIEPF